jgi:hypothetical protein
MMGIKWLRETRRTQALAVVGAFLVVGMLAAAPAATASTPAADCQPFAEPCLLPFPNDLFTKPDPTSATGVRVNLPPGSDAGEHERRAGRRRSL